MEESGGVELWEICIDSDGCLEGTGSQCDVQSRRHVCLGLYQEAPGGSASHSRALASASQLFLIPHPPGEKAQAPLPPSPNLSAISLHKSWAKLASVQGCVLTAPTRPPLHPQTEVRCSQPILDRLLRTCHPAHSRYLCCLPPTGHKL